MHAGLEPPPRAGKATIGHAGVRERFVRTLTAGRLASTYLFVGPRGVGKRTFAEELAGVLLCTGPVTADRLSRCGQCESCRLFDQGEAPDLLRVALPEGKSSLPLELFIGPKERRHREGLCHDLAVKPLLSSRRVAIIDDADTLGAEGANALLKTLEEPPPRAVILLIGTSLSRQLPTIRSRSQVIRFGALTSDEVTQILAERDLLPEEADPGVLAARSGGSVSHALAAGDDSLEAFRAVLHRALASEPVDTVRFGAAVIGQSQAGSTEPAVRRERLRQILAMAVDFYRTRLRDAAQANAFTAFDRLVERLDRTLSALEDLDRNANQATLVQAWLAEL
ncbi:MAG: DNA polymerase III subunit delta' [Planctomycetota bacterium]